MKLLAFKDKLIQLIDQSACQATIEKAIFDFYLTKPLPILEVSHPFLARARVNLNGEIFSKVGQLSCNPDTSKIKMQRANYPGQ